MTTSVPFIKLVQDVSTNYLHVARDGHARCNSRYRVAPANFGQAEAVTCTRCLKTLRASGLAREGELYLEAWLIGERLSAMVTAAQMNTAARR